jgi:hypothetical protein
MKSTLIPTIQALIAPIAAPFAQSVILGAEIFRVLLAMQVIYWLALLSAIAGALAIEASGGLAFYMAVRGWQKRQPGVILTAMVAVGIYLLIVITSIISIPSVATKSVAAMTGIAVVAYLSWALFQADRQGRKDSDDQFNHDLALLKEKRLLLNAERRHNQSRSEPVTVYAGSPPTNQTPAFQNVAFAIMDGRGDIGVRALQVELKNQLGSCSSSTAKRYRDKWLELRKSNEQTN